MEISLDTILRTFQTEAEEHLDSLEEALVALEARPRDAELLQAAFRSAHTIKGAARCVELEQVAAFAHRVEDAFERLRDGGRTLDAPTASLLLEAVDALRQMIGSAVDGEELAVPESQASIDRWLAGEALAPAPAGPEPEPEAEKEAARQVSALDRRARTLRVDIDKLDRMLDLMGEVAVARGRLGGLLDSGAGPSQLRDAHRDADRFYLDLQELLMKARMVPLSTAFKPHVRTVRDLAVAQGKQVRLVIEGGEVEVDNAIIEGLRDPLTHLVRNAVDHGLETPQVRQAKGKNPVGTVTLAARREGGRILIEVWDDGAGLDRERIAARARKTGVCENPERLSEEELSRLILLPGFTTSEKVTEVSGRGVGMDVVSRNVQALHGSLAIDSKPGHGTRFIVGVPLTLAIVDGFTVGAADETYVLPIESVVECIELPRSQSEQGRSTGVLSLRGEPLPYLRLRDFFGLTGPRDGRESVVVIRHGEGRAGLAVDALYGEGQTVIKPLAGLFRRVPGVSGSALLGNGRVALILDIPNLMRAALAAEDEALADAAAPSSSTAVPTLTQPNEALAQEEK